MSAAQALTLRNVGGISLLPQIWRLAEDRVADRET